MLIDFSRTTSNFKPAGYGFFKRTTALWSDELKTQLFWPASSTSRNSLSSGWCMYNDPCSSPHHPRLFFSYLTVPIARSPLRLSPWLIQFKSEKRKIQLRWCDTASNSQFCSSFLVLPNVHTLLDACTSFAHIYVTWDGFAENLENRFIFHIMLASFTYIQENSGASITSSSIYLADVSIQPYLIAQSALEREP